MFNKYLKNMNRVFPNKNYMIFNNQNFYPKQKNLTNNNQSKKLYQENNNMQYENEDENNILDNQYYPNPETEKFNYNKNINSNYFLKKEEDTLNNMINDYNNENEDENYLENQNNDDNYLKIIENLKEQNNKYRKRILDLENQNKKLNYELVGMRLKLKGSQKNKINFNTNNNELSMINTKLKEYEILVSKLKLDKKVLETEIENLKKNNENEKKILQNNLNNDNNSKNNIPNNFDDYYSLQYENENLKNKIMEQENIIQLSFNKLNELKKKLDDNQINNMSNEEISKIIMERDDLLDQNKKLTMGINSFNEKVKEISEIYNKRSEIYNNNLNSYKKKVDEYKNKIIILKKKIDELYDEKNQMKNNPANTNKGLLRNYTTAKLEKYRRSLSNHNKSLDIVNKTDVDIINTEDNINVDNEQKKFVEDYKIFLDNLGKE